MPELVWTAPHRYAEGEAGKVEARAMTAWLAEHGLDASTIARSRDKSARIWRDGDRTELHVEQYVLNADGHRHLDPDRPDMALTRTRIVELVSEPPELAPL